MSPTTIDNGETGPTSPATAKGPEGTTAHVLAFPLMDSARARVIPPVDAGNAAETLDLEGDDRSIGLGRLWNAINEDRLVLHYQPQIDFATGKTRSVEALVRIVEDDELIYPDRFIALAEDSGMIVPLGRAVIRRACRDLAAWRRRGHALERVAINVAAQQLVLDDELPEFVDRTLRLYELSHTDLEFELTERQALDAGAGRDRLRALTDAGIRIALDDFGTGFSSMAYLTTLEVRTVKIDRCLVAALPGNGTAGHIVGHLISLARTLGIDVVAEGIETPAQQAFLRNAGASLGQGYLHARPVPAAALERML